MARRDVAAAAGRALAVIAAWLLLAAPATAAAAAPRASLTDIEDEVMCVQCGTALNISNSVVAEDQRDFIREMIAAGRTKAEIKEALVAEYGRSVLASPSSDGFGIAVYVVPPLLALLGLVGVVLAARRWRGGRRGAPAQPALTDGDAERLDRDMAAYDL